MPVRWRDAAATGIMKYDPKMHHRRSIRLPGYDYASPGSYFVTVCTHQRKLLFGEVIAGQMHRNALGDIVHAEWYATERVRPEIRLDAFVVMPNHLHGILEIIDVGARRGLAPHAHARADNAEMRATHRVAPTAGARSRPHGPAPGSIGAILGQIKSLTKKAINKTRGTPGRPFGSRIITSTSFATRRSCSAFASTSAITLFAGRPTGKTRHAKATPRMKLLISYRGTTTPGMDRRGEATPRPY